MPPEWLPYFTLTGEDLGCVCEGTRQVKGSHDAIPVQRQDAARRFHTAYRTEGRANAYTSAQHTDPDGTETIPAWTCAPGCPVAALDAQSGERPGASSNSNGTTAWFGGQSSPTVPGYADTGGASRFFPVFAYDAADFAPFLYCGKASRRERNEGCEGLPEYEGGTMDGGHVVSEGRTAAKTGRRPTTNHHSTVKPVKLMEWLCRLVCPPGGVILDPFLGSGTTGVAAVRLGFSFVGIEREEDYMLIAQARITAAATRARQLPLAV